MGRGLSRLWGAPRKTTSGSKGAKVAGNLAHKFMDVYFLCLSFHLDITNRLETTRK